MSYSVWLSWALLFYPSVVFLGSPILFLQPLQHLQPKQCFFWSSYKLRNGANVFTPALIEESPSSKKIDRFFAFKALFNVHLHRSFKKVISLPRWKPVIRHLRASSRERCTQGMLVVAGLGWLPSPILQSPPAHTKLQPPFPPLNIFILPNRRPNVRSHSVLFDLIWFCFHFSFELK